MEQEIRREVREMCEKNGEVGLWRESVRTELRAELIESVREKEERDGNMRRMAENELLGNIRQQVRQKMEEELRREVRETFLGEARRQIEVRFVYIYIVCVDGHGHGHGLLQQNKLYMSTIIPFSPTCDPKPSRSSLRHPPPCPPAYSARRSRRRSSRRPRGGRPRAFRSD